MSVLARCVAVAWLVLVPRLAASQQSQPDTASRAKALPGAMELGLSDSTQRRIAQTMASDMGNLRKAEASYYAAHHIFAFALADLAPFKMTGGNALSIFRTDGGGYRAVATNPALPGAEAEVVVPAPAH
jgi:hypothetical protein